MNNIKPISTVTSAILTVFTTIGLISCGGSDSGTTSPTILSGVLIDSPVSNISYSTATQTGTTNAQGEYSYIAGETVTFSIGNLVLPLTTAGAIVTPLTLAGASTVTDQQASNIARLLQSLDSNGDPTDGIAIPSAAAGAAAAVDFNVNAATFEGNADVINLIANSTSITTTLIAAATAEAHVTTTLADLEDDIVSSWIIGDTGLSFFSDGTFVYGESGGELPNGLEAGTYTYDPSSNEVTFNVTVDLNSDGGIKTDSNSTVTFPAVITPSQATFTVDGADLTLANVPASNTGVIGVWRPADKNATLALLSNGSFIYGETGGTAPNGLEAGSYTYDGTNITFTIIYDDNDPGNDSGIGNIGTPVVADAALSNGDATMTLLSGSFVLEREY